MIRTRRQIEPAFTLAEALLAAVVLAATIPAIAMPFTAAAQSQQAEGRFTVAVNLAQELMEEILSQPFRDPQGSSAPGPESGETSRELFDNVDDYHGYAEPAGEIVAVNGQVVDCPVAAGLSRHVSADYVHVKDQDTSEPPLFVRVVVEMQYKGQTVVTLTRLVYAMQKETAQ